MAKLQYLLNIQRSDGNYIPYHYHPCYEIVFYGGGCGVSKCVSNEKKTQGDNFIEFEELSVACEEIQELRFEKNSLLFYEPYTYHDELHTTGGRIMAIGFVTDTPLSLTKYQYYKLSDDCIRYIHTIAGEYAVRKKHHMKAIDALLELLLIELERMNAAENIPQKNFESVKNYIDNYYMTNIKIKELAESYFYTTDHFIRIFKKKFGMYPKQYILKLRLDESLRLLKSTELSVGEIGVRVGYHTNSDFSAFIKKYTGKSPTQIREESRGGMQ